MTSELISSGFEVFYVRTENRKFLKKDFNPKNNWFGLSLYEPEGYFVRGDKSVLMSLQGVSIPVNKDIYDKYNDLFNKRSIRYICLKDKGQVLYEDYTGNLPPKELVNEFIK